MQDYNEIFTSPSLLLWPAPYAERVANMCDVLLANRISEQMADFGQVLNKNGTANLRPNVN